VLLLGIYLYFWEIHDIEIFPEIILIIFFVVVSSDIPCRKMLNLQHQHNNHTTTPHMRVDPTHCVVVVMVLCMNQIPMINSIALIPTIIVFS